MKIRTLGRFFRPTAGVIAATAVAASLAGCVTNEEGGHPDGWQEIKPAAIAEVQALVPREIASQGKVTIGTNPPFAPMEFKDSDANIIGVDIDLARAAASVMGLELVVQEQDFNLILPSITAGTLDFGASGFTDNEERRKNYDFVNYLSAGIQWASQTGHPVDPDNACGLTVAVQKGTVSETDDVAPRSEKCLEEGKEPIKMLVYEKSDAAATALVLGRADAFSADSPVTAFAIARSDGRIEPTGEMFDAADYGWPLPKQDPLTPALQAALQHLIDTGEYQKILEQWGITEGQLSRATVNGE